MSSSESEVEDCLSEFEDNNTDDHVDSDIAGDEDCNIVHDIASNVIDDVHNNMSNDLDDGDDNCDIEDTDRFLELYDSFQEPATSDYSQSHPVDDSFMSHVRSAIGPFSHSSSNLNVSLSSFGDSLDAYLFAPPLIQRTTASKSCYFSYEPTTDTTGSKLFVGNVPIGTTWEQLKEFFVKQGYSVKHVNLQFKPVSRVPGYAFVRFSTTKIATLVLHDSISQPSKFVFCGIKLRISHCKPSHQQIPKKTTTTEPANSASDAVNLNITDIYYGTLITGAAMKNIYREENNVIGPKTFGIIANSLFKFGYNLPSRFVIDEKNKTFAIIVSNNSMYENTIASGVCVDLEFEWNFRDLKGDKINPVLVDNGSIYLLLELKRPPIILQKTMYMLEDDTDEIRLPGTPLIGHANGWLFKLNYTNLNVYPPLFKVLRRYNLSPRQFSERNIIDLINLKGTENKRLKSIRLLSNERWVRKHQDIVDDFRRSRWPSYPFETKFEIMKLISKHIITFHDLIVDEKAETILEQCSINTLIACTDKIVEQAPRWFSVTCDNDDEDWDQENEQEKQQQEPDDNELSILIQHIPLVDDESSQVSQFRSSTGASVNVSNTEQITITTNMTKLSNLAKEHQLGTFSRLLLFALAELIKKHELRRITNTGMYVTKDESRTWKTLPFLIRKIYITPSTIFYEGPYREEKCAVTRHFEEQQDRFLRVTFRDEDYRILHNYNDNMTKMYERIKEILKNGVTMCDRKYEFLAFSSSQLREHSCWMFASMDDGITSDGIRKWMGDFRDVSSVAKFAARLGQSFSASVKGIKLEETQFKRIPDVIRPDENLRDLCFTDGIGIIAPWLAEKLITEVNPSDTTSCPSAFQIRCGGFKGMVCLDVNNCIPPGEIGVHFRDSMKKFDATNFSIDVVHTSSHPSLAYLNRQIILLLSSLGISDRIFLSLQDRMLQKLLALTGDSRNACKALRDFNEFGGNGCHAFLIDYLRTLGKQKEPFVRRILFAFQAFLVKELRAKAKILVPNSWCLFGVIDETKILNYGQVFIQIDNTSQQGGSSKILQGPVTVTRNPCFHPGDIRRLEAVDIPGLHKLKNVIVFPINGDRPHPLEMSGGDLDGDTFWICNDKDLIFESNVQPFDYKDQIVEAERKAQSGGSNGFTIEDVCDFFGEYIKADNLGIIANSHLAFADQLPGGAQAEICLKLAKMHSIAVDFAKNGVKALGLTRELRPRQYPHYMEKKDKPFYQSATILGKLYDEIQCYKTDLNIDQKEEITATSSFPYKSFNIDGYKAHIKYANVIKNEYERELKRVMRQYGIKHEVELVSGYILKFISKQYSNETKIFDLRNEINHAYKVIRDKYLRIFWEQFYQPRKNESTDEPQEETTKWSEISKKLTWKNQLDVLKDHDQITSFDEVKKKASAWFHVTYDPWIKYMKKNGRSSMKNRHMSTIDHRTEQEQRFKGLFSFAWLIYPVLLKIVNQKEDDSMNDAESKKKRKKKKNNRKKNSSVPPHNNN